MKTCGNAAASSAAYVEADIWRQACKRMFNVSVSQWLSCQRNESYSYNLWQLPFNIVKTSCHGGGNGVMAWRNVAKLIFGIGVSAGGISRERRNVGENEAYQYGENQHGESNGRGGVARSIGMAYRQPYQ
jgi:hypothetical protein